MKISSYFHNKMKFFRNLLTQQESIYRSTAIENNQLPFKAIYSAKLLISILLRKILILPSNTVFETGNNIFSLVLIAFWLPIRYFLVLTIKSFDLLAPPPYGSQTLPINRTIYYGPLSLKVKSRSKGIDIRNNIWKKQVLTMLLEHLKKKKLPANISFLEIGAASGLVSLFLAKWAKKNIIETKITCIEPSLQNVQFLEETALENNLNIDIIPLALSHKNGWIQFQRDSTKGLVGSAVNNSSIINNVVSINFDLLRSYLSNTNICYIDALLNEEKILIEMLEKFPGITTYIIEFDNGITDEIKRKFEYYSYSCVKKTGFNYLFIKSGL